MEHTFVYQAAAMVQRQHRRRNWRTVFTALAAVVVFVTVYMLILPAITMERPIFCGMEEHVHTDECYTWELVCTEGEPAQGPADGLPEGRRPARQRRRAGGRRRPARTDRRWVRGRD